VNVAKPGAPNPARTTYNTSSSPAGTVSGGSIGESSSADYIDTPMLPLSHWSITTTRQATAKIAQMIHTEARNFRCIDVAGIE
jgi:hypothetical protein